MSIAKPTLVLVHGAWHSVQCFDLLQRELQSRGWTTETPAHVSPGDQSGTVHTADNARIIRQTLQKLCDEGKTIVLVAHSYGGCTASCAVEGLSLRARRASGRAGGVVMFVYLSAFIIPAGTSMTQAFGEKLSTWHKVDVSKLRPWLHSLHTRRVIHCLFRTISFTPIAPVSDSTMMWNQLSGNNLSGF